MANANLNGEIKRLKRQAAEDNQYGRRENVEISGIPSSIPNEKLEEAVIAIAEKTGNVITSKDISACHRLKGDSTIVRFVNQKHAESLLDNSRRLRNIKQLSSVGNDKPLYINPNLSPDLRKIRWKASIL